MNPEKKAAWVAALRSGKYIQVADSLTEGGNCFCVFGLLNHISELGEWAGDGGYVVVSDLALRHYFVGHKWSTFLGKNVEKHPELRRHCGKSAGPRFLEGLSELELEGVRSSIRGERSLLHLDVAAWAGLDTQEPSVYFEDQMAKRSLSDLNDEGVSFEVLANLIEAQL